MNYILMDIDGVISPLGSIPEEDQFFIVPETQYVKWPMRTSVVNALLDWKSRDDVTWIWASTHEEDSNEIFVALELEENEWISFTDWTREKLVNVVETIDRLNPDDRIIWIDDENHDLYQQWCDSSGRDILFIAADGVTGLTDHDIDEINDFIDRS